MLGPDRHSCLDLVCTHVYTPTNFVVGILFSRCPSVRPSVTFCFFLIISCKHVYICKTNTSNEKVRARGQFY